MPDFCGVHATNKTRADLILRNGFRHGSSDGSRRGTGVYFWPIGAYHRELAAGHYELAKKHYRNTEDQACVFIFAQLFVEDGEFVDLTDFEIMNGLLAVIKEKKLKTKEMLQTFMMTIVICWKMSWGII